MRAERYLQFRKAQMAQKKSRTEVPTLEQVQAEFESQHPCTVGISEGVQNSVSKVLLCKTKLATIANKFSF